MSIKIDVKRTGFPVMVGELELFFDSSVEKLRKFFNAEEIAQTKLKEAQEKARHIHFPDEITEETIDVAIDLSKEHTAIQYDIIFGDGAFKKIYEKYPDIIALEGALEPLGLAIAEKIEQQEEEREKEVEKRKKEYLDKKAKK